MNVSPISSGVKGDLMLRHTERVRAVRGLQKIDEG